MPYISDEDRAEAKRKIKRFDAFMVDTTFGRFISAIVAIILAMVVLKIFVL